MIIVKPPTGNEMQLDVSEDISQDELLTLLRAQHGNNPSLKLAKIDTDEPNEDGTRVVTLKTNAKPKG